MLFSRSNGPPVPSCQPEYASIKASIFMLIMAYHAARKNTETTNLSSLFMSFRAFKVAEPRDVHLETPVSQLFYH